MTVFAADISSYEHGLRIADLVDCAAVMAKCTEGTYYADADYAGWRAQTAAAGKPFVAYHFVSPEDPVAQARYLAAHIGDRSLPVMLDWEPEDGRFSPTYPQLYNLARAMLDEGLRPRVAYVPRWYWSQTGQPDLNPLVALGLGIVSSAYPGGTGTAAQLYPGDNAAGWQPYRAGQPIPVLYQFTSQARDGGQLLDMNAYRGTAAQLAALLGAPHTTGGTDMGTIPPSISQKWPELAGDFPANASFTDESALIWADAGARAAATYALQARDTARVLADQLAQLRAQVSALGFGLSTDVQAVATGVAAALGPLLHPTFDPVAVAAALAPLLPGVDEQKLAADLVAHIVIKP